MPSQNEKIYLNAIKQIPEIGPINFKKLLNYFKSASNIWECCSYESLKKAGLTNKETEIFLSEKKQIYPEKEFEKLQKENIDIISFDDPEYPELLKEIYAPPIFLYIKGSLPSPKENPCLAVVGARKYSLYGKQVTNKLVKEIASLRITIISGLALGIDALAHRAALEAGGKTIAIIGSGIDKSTIYPSCNLSLAEKIIEEDGAVVSEYSCGDKAHPGYFPQRNRIISGLSLGTLVIEARKKSGTLITASFALEQNREVFAVPGSIFNTTSEGANELIKKGAHSATCAQDILDNLELNTLHITNTERKDIKLSPEESVIIRIAQDSPIHIDQIIAKSNLPASLVNTLLVTMEIEEKIKNLGNMYYMKV